MPALPATDDLLPTLGLNVDLLETQLVQRDNAIDAAVARTPDALQVGAARAVTHAMEQVQNDGLEERRRDLSQNVKELCRDGSTNLRQSCLQAIVRACRGHWVCRQDCRVCVFVTGVAKAHVNVSRCELLELAFGQGLGVSSNEPHALWRELPKPATRAARQPRALETIVRPSGAILVNGLHTARQELLSIRF
jgi:hypothetical protein